MLSTARISSAVYSNIRSTQAFRKTSYWAHIEKAPEDAIFGITNAFNQDKSPLKINLGVGAYRDDKGKPWILPSVREAEKRLHESGLDHEYAAINGIAAFTKAAAKLAYGEQSGCIQENRVAVAQSISGTGALRIGAAFLNQFMKDKSGAVYIPNPTWPNHVNVFQSSGFKVNRYRYYDPRTKKVDMDGLIHDIRDAPKNSVFLLHACAHNPTGVDPTMGQWEDLMKELKKSGQSAFALVGDLARNVFPHLQAHIPQYLPVMVENMNPFPHVAVCNNAIWASGEIAVVLGANMSSFIPGIMNKIVVFYQQQNVSRYLMENVSITIGRFGLAAPNLIAPHLHHFFGPWCSFMRSVIDDREKVQAVRGMLQMLALNPAVISSHFASFCDVIIGWSNIPTEIDQIVGNMLTQFRASFSAQDWATFWSSIPQAISHILSQRYNLN